MKYIIGLLYSLVLLNFSCQQTSSDQEYDLFIKNAQVIDGSGEEPYFAQILVQDGKIVLIEKDTLASYKAKKIINAYGSVVSPGFIDTHTHGDPLNTPEFQNFLAMGVTTIFLGQDGSSPSTTNLSKWMDSVDQIHPGVNIGMFAGHGTVRMLSGVKYDKTPSEQALSAMDKILRAAMDAGSFGMTTGLEYNPGYVADQAELNRMAKVVGEKGGIVMSHMRNEDDGYILASLDELLAQGEYSPVHVSHIKIVYGKGTERAHEILRKLENERRAGKVVTADLYPYEASYTSISILFPDWAKPPANYKEVVADRRKELEDYLRNKVIHRNGPEATLIGTGPFKGKTLAEIAAVKNKPFEKVLVDDIGPSGTSAAYFVMDEMVMKEFLKDPYVNICSDGSPTSNHPRSFGTFAKIIESYVINEPLLTLPEAIHKMTGLAAKHVGLTGRGLIEVGMAADLVVFNPYEVKAKATYEHPDQLAEGFKYVIVNGQLAKEKSDFKERAGKILKK
ncbi:N-acyl-D-amino-acid deacylase family protein [Anditalea andensis]|uniref:N-acyl-D-amino acid deacylase n=1 Tax=Anditalea andensis TaxID=1048983 RepID=A0A074KR42_9BACT|nr:amidohydrolase family protein [Anditalea andensis]KEO72421.1 N-acyl-D-amino acid deacylase [Anditalea andensis]